MSFLKRNAIRCLLPLFALLLCSFLMSMPVSSASGINAYCQHCQKTALWQPLSGATASSSILSAGHYYVDTQSLTSMSVRSGNRVCIDLRGISAETGYGRAFTINTKGTLNIQDSVGGGILTGTGYDPGTQISGGVITIPDAQSCFNLYSGTLTSRLEGDRSVYNGGIINTAGIFNMYGGAIRDGVSHLAGGNVYVSAGGQMRIYGGEITGGSAQVANTECVVNRGTLTIGGNGKIQSVRLWPNADNPPLQDMLIVDGAFTGDICLYITDPRDGMDIGNLQNGGSFAPENLHTFDSSFLPYAQGADILLTQSSGAAVYGENGFERYTETAQEAIELCQGTNKTAVLQKDNSEALTATQTLFLDLNGYRCEHLTVTDATAYIKDSATDDYTGSYGVLLKPTGAIQAAEGYMLYKETSGISFHAYSLEIDAAVLRPSIAGMYFTAYFKGDASLIKSYGIAIDVNGPPSLSTLNKSSVHTSIREPLVNAVEKGPFLHSVGANSVLITHILREENARSTNQRNAELTVYGRPFIRFNDNTFVFGETQSISFRELLEKADAMWTEEAIPTLLQELYRDYADTMERWNIPNLKKAALAPAPSPYKVPSPYQPADIDSIPIATADMDVRQLRQICVDFFREQLTFQWVLEEDTVYSSTYRHVSLKAGTVYMGNPYTHGATRGNLYTAMEYYDPDTGVLRNPGYTGQVFSRLIGNHCISGSFWGWARVINSTTSFMGDETGLEAYGYLPLGDYSTAGVTQWVEGTGDTASLIRAAGKQTILEGYALLQMADGLFLYKANPHGCHILMASQDAVVVRKTDGSIDPDKSYITILDQGSGWDKLEIGGTTAYIQGGVDKVWTFTKLYNDGYVPITFGEFIGTNPVEKSVTSSSLSGLTTVTPAQLAEMTVTSNYSISHVRYSVTDKTGSEIHRQIAFPYGLGSYEMDVATWVKPEDFLPFSGERLTVTCRISTGETVTLFDGVIA